jgi:hypothetical protein
VLPPRYSARDCRSAPEEGGREENAHMAKGQVGTNQNNKPKLSTKEKQKKKKEKQAAKAAKG